MGALGMTVFCSNGHICQQTIHHEISPYNPKKCWCGSTEMFTQFEWGDPDYTQFVSKNWLYYAWRWSKKQQKMIKFHVYDVTELKEHYQSKDCKK